MSIFVFALRLVLALCSGAAIGIERQWRQKSAGLRTNTLVSLGSAAYVLLSIHISGDAPGRVASYIISGIGFLGAGVIMKDGLNVQGLNTAATIWCSAAVGSLIGFGLIGEAVITASLVVLTHLILRPLGIKLSKITFFEKSETVQSEYLINIQCREKIENHLRILLMQYLGNDDKLMLRALTSSEAENPSVALIVAEIITVGKQDYLIEKMVSRLTIEQDVLKVSWEVIGHQTEL
ncbi:MgtC/SapB family protein [Mucilaginibacter sp. 44-25]|uniref:MgtC/SapB family protein n=1 Tax=Mucilaginibacter sp. 44-25 TaxID=1895794 RepID=UPI000966959B|nr:MgtC/SapB family protein [Mucilaginibacter sp. 44-25]OJW18191.1 MAG: magnesium transporter MgtC [Mucilaginibacter sp. 44-25]HEK19434.1 MgtC/SapB family protein [Bacteroidota bacterium]